MYFSFSKADFLPLFTVLLVPFSALNAQANPAENFSLGECNFNNRKIGVSVWAIRNNNPDIKTFEVTGFALTDLISRSASLRNKYQDQGSVVRMEVRDNKGEATYDLGTYISIVPATPFQLSNIPSIARIEIAKLPQSGTDYGKYQYSLIMGNAESCKENATNIEAVLIKD